MAKAQKAQKAQSWAVELHGASSRGMGSPGLSVCRRHGAGPAPQTLGMNGQGFVQCTRMPDRHLKRKTHQF